MGSSPAGSEKLCENFYQELGDRSSSFVWVFWTFGRRGGRKSEAILVRRYFY